MNAPRVSFNILNLSFSVSSALSGISCVEGVTLRGPFANAGNILISSWPQFVALYGGYISNSDFPLLCNRAFALGSQLRVNRVGHYTTITNASTLDAVTASMIPAKIITFSAALVASNVYNVTINTLAIAPVTYATSSDLTMAAIVTAIKALTTVVQDAYIIPAGSGLVRQIIIVPLGAALTITGSVVTLGASQATTAITSQTQIADVNGNVIFTAAPQYAGANYNYLSVVISAASNGNANYFNMAINHSIEPSLNESYANLTVIGNPNVSNSHYLDNVKGASQLMNFTYADLSATTGQINPRQETYNYALGSDGSTPINTDYIGDPAGQNGLHAFDTVSDAMQVGAPEMDETLTGLHAAGDAYASGRQDMMYFAHLSNSNTTTAALLSARSGTSINSYWTAFFAGGLTVTDPNTGLSKNISELGDVFGIMAVNDAVGPWKQPAGINRAVINNVIGVVNNFGTPAMYNSMNSLCNQQINMVVNVNNTVYINSGFTGVQSDSKLSFISTVRFLIWLKSSLAPTLLQYLQEPGDIPTFYALFRQVEPFFNNLQTLGAIASGSDGWAWQGDQNASDLDHMIVNNPTDVAAGNYKVNLYIETLTPIQQISCSLIVTSSGVSLSLSTGS